MSQKFHHTSWLLLLLLLLGSKPIAIAQTLLQRNYSGLPDGAQQTLHSEASRLTDLVNAYFRTTGFQVLDVGLYDLSLNMQGEQSFDVAFQTADAEVQGQAIPAARQPILRSNLNLNAYLLMVWQVAAGGRSLKLRWKLRLPDNGTIPPAELLELEGILTGMGSQVAELQIANLGLGKWAEAAGAGVKKIADLLERKMRGEDVLAGEVYLTRISFNGFIPIENYPDPKWMRNKPGDETISDPLCYVRSAEMKLLPVFSCPNLPEKGRIQLKIKYGNDESMPVNLKYDKETQTLILKGKDTVSFIVDTKVNYYQAFKIEWLISFDQPNTWTNAGTSSHEIFITFKRQPQDYISIKKSNLFYGCTQGLGRDNEEELIKALWEPFESLSLHLKQFKPDQEPIPFTYYLSPGGGCFNTILEYAPDIVYGKKVIEGQCGAFAELFMNVLSNQGLSNFERITIKPKKDKAFIVNKWQFISETEPGKTYPYRNLFRPNTLDGQDSPRSSLTSSTKQYNQWIIPPLAIDDVSGEKGQNVDNPYSDFEEHHVVQFSGGVIYDPSYGKKYTSVEEWAKKSIAGFLDVFRPYNDLEKTKQFLARQSANPYEDIEAK